MIPKRPRKHVKFWGYVRRILDAFDTPYPVEVVILKNSPRSKNSGYLWRDAIRRKKFRVRVSEWNTGHEQADLELMVDTFVHEFAHVLHYQPHHEITVDAALHDEAWGVYFSKVYCVAYQTK